jgi:hypothetical protein
MKEKRSSRRANGGGYFFLHTVVWLIGWGFGIHFASVLDYNGSFVTGLFLLLWTILFVVHASVYYSSKARSDSAGRERQAYRDGYNDAMRELMIADHTDAPRRLTMDEDGELVEMPLESKRKNR